MLSYRDVCRQLSTVYDAGEAQAVARQLYADGHGLSFADICMGRDTLLADSRQQLLAAQLQRLLDGEPVQYVVGSTLFCGRRFQVGPGILIPRPETELLCHYAEQFSRQLDHDGRNDEHTAGQCQPSAGASGPYILDVGTGSGCIAVTLALNITGSRVTALDVSPECLAVARSNAAALGADVTFLHEDILRPCSALRSLCWHLIVSNPPYVCRSERAAMQPQVLNHEPAQALFVPDDDPLLFYRAIAHYALSTLFPDGRLLFECNTAYVSDVAHCLRQLGFAAVSISDDQFGNPRFVCAVRPNPNSAS